MACVAGHPRLCAAVPGCAAPPPGVRTGDDSLDVPDSRPDLSILCHPVVSFESAVHQGSINNLLGASPSAELLAGLSAELTVTAHTPPAFIWHTSDEGAVDAGHSLRYALALREAAVPAELHVFPHGRHGLGLAVGVAGVERWTELCGTWLAGNGWSAAWGRRSQPGVSRLACFHDRQAP